MSTVYVAPPYAWLILAVTLIYIGSVIYLWRYLREHHPTAWKGLGSPSLTQPNVTAIQSALYTSWFIFSPRYASLGDARLSRLIWTIRAEFLLIIALIIIGKAYDLVPPR